MAPVKRSRAKKPQRKSRARQTTLGEFPILLQPATAAIDPAATPTVRRSTRGTRGNQDSLSVLLLPTSSGRSSARKTKKPPRQQKLQLQKDLPDIPSASPPQPPPRSPDFAVVILVSPKKHSSQQPTQTGAPVDLDQDNKSPPFHQSTRGKGKVNRLAYHDPGSSDGGSNLVEKEDKHVKPPIHISLESSDDDPVTAARGRKTPKGKGKQVEPAGEKSSHGLSESKEASGEEKEDLEEDLAYLSSKHHVLPSRTRYNGSSPKKTPYQRKLDELRAKRAGKPIREDRSFNDDRPKRALYDTDDEDDEDGDNDENLEATSSNKSTSDDESWIVEDDGSTTIGAPDAQIPLQFTSLSHQSTRANFKICCIWIVQSILNPEFPSDDEISMFAIRALDRRINSYGGSVLQSSIWKAPFMRAMKARPAFESEPCEERQTCDACDISGRTATFAVTFNGPRYDKETLENLEGSDDDSEDSTGLSIPDESKLFYLGRNCHARAQIAHAFIHWKKQLRDAIHEILGRQGYFTPYWNNRMAKMSPEERTRWANNVTDDLGDQIQEFYHDLKRSLDNAQSNMTSQRSKKWR